MKYLIAILMIVFVIGCTGDPVQDTIEPEDPVMDEVKEPPKEEPTETPTETGDQDPDDTDSLKETKEAMSDQSKEILGLAAKRVTRGLEYTYFGPETLPASYNYWIKGDKIKIEFPKGGDYRIDQEFFKYVYLDKESSKAMVVCSEDSGACESGPQEIPFGLYGNIKTPLDWIKEITSMDIVSTENLHSREVYRAESNIGMVWIDTYTGVPLQIEKDGKTLLRVEGFIFNQVKDEDVNYQ